MKVAVHAVIIALTAAYAEGFSSSNKQAGESCGFLSTCKAGLFCPWRSKWGSAIRDKCKAKGAAGDTCYSDDNCGSGTVCPTSNAWAAATKNKCMAPATTSGAECHMQNQCGAGFACFTAWNWNATMEDKCWPALTAGETCHDTHDCKFPYYCAGSNGDDCVASPCTCKAQKANGENCRDNFECTGYCKRASSKKDCDRMSGCKCAALVAIGNSCEDNDECGGINMRSNEAQDPPTDTPKDYATCSGTPAKCAAVPAPTPPIINGNALGKAVATGIAIVVIVPIVAGVVGCICCIGIIVYCVKKKSSNTVIVQRVA